MKFSIRLILLIFLFASYGCVEESKEREVSNFELPAEEEDFEEAKFKVKKLTSMLNSKGIKADEIHSFLENDD
mgnify:CR=1 FL=1